MIGVSSPPAYSIHHLVQSSCKYPPDLQLPALGWECAAHLRKRPADAADAYVHGGAWPTADGRMAHGGWPMADGPRRMAAALLAW